MLLYDNWKYFTMPDGEPVKWLNITKGDEVTAHIAYYYSDQDANLPVRGIRKKYDSKADPNIETGTYGLFTTCMPPARRNMVERGDSYIFFFTNWKNQRILTGYYELAQYVDTGITPMANGKARKFKDYALLAKKVHFVKNGIPFTGKQWSKIKVKNIKNDYIAGYGPRDFKRIGAEMALALKKLLDKQRNITHVYIKEMQRLEKENLEKHGFRYPSWHRMDGFSQKDFGGYVK